MIDNVDESLVEKLWHDLDGQVSREQISRVVAEIAARFQTATVTAFVPIFIHRQALEELRSLLFSEGHPVASSVLAADDERQGRELPAEYSNG
jgi:hypothetical protein